MFKGTIVFRDSRFCVKGETGAKAKTYYGLTFKVKGKACCQAGFKLPSGWDASSLQGYIPAVNKIGWYPFISLDGERHYESKVTCLRTDRSAPARS